MDKRNYKRVAFFAGLLFLITAVEAILFSQLVKSVHETDQERLGAFVSLDKKLETDAVRIMNGKDNEGKLLSKEDRELLRQAGEALEHKYGYTLRKPSDMRQIERYAFLIGGILAAGAAAAALLLGKDWKVCSEAAEEAEQLREKLHELEAHFKSVKRNLEKEENDTKSLITDISHQLKTPIASLHLSCELAETTALSETEMREFQKNEFEEVKKLETLLDSLLNLSKLEAKIIQIKPYPASLKNTLVNAVNSVYMKAFEKNIDISLEEFEDTELPHDVKWTAEAFVNILDNGIKYSPEDTKIQIRAEALTSYMLVEIEDEGTGISSQEAHQIFKRFYRGDNETVKKQEGSGVGLYLARKILEEQGGTISVKNGPQRGSTFRVTLPLS